jgi:hypothetical protein
MNKTIIVAAAATATLAVSYIGLRQNWFKMPNFIANCMPNAVNKHFDDIHLERARKVAAEESQRVNPNKKDEPSTDVSDTIDETVPENTPAEAIEPEAEKPSEKINKKSSVDGLNAAAATA